MRSPEEMLLLLTSALAEGASVTDLPSRACSAAVETLRCDSGALTLGHYGADRVTLCATDDTARAVDDAQGIVGQGPSVEALRTGRDVSLRIDGGGEELSDPRWPMLSVTALRDVGPLMVHAVPLRVPEDVIGVLTLLRRGEKTDFDHDVAREVADVVAAVVLASAPADPGDMLGTPWMEHAEIFQATGMVMAQMHLGENDALTLLRAHSFASGTSLYSTAQQVLSRRLRFDEGAGEETLG